MKITVSRSPYAGLRTLFGSSTTLLVLGLLAEQCGKTVLGILPAVYLYAQAQVFTFQTAVGRTS